MSQANARAAKPLGILAILSMLVASLVTALSAGAAASAASPPSELPFTVTNNSGDAVSTYIYIIGTNTSNGQMGYVDSSGNFNAWQYPSSIPNGPVATPNFAINGPATGSAETLYLPENVAGGRMYMSFGAPLQFFLTTSGLVEPAPWSSGDPNRNVLFDWVEFARSATGIDINTTMVDMFSVPFSVSVTDTSGSSQTEGQLVSGGRNNIFSGISALGGNWSNLVYNDPSTGQPLRVISPLHGEQASPSEFSSTFFDSYTAAVWSYYSSHTLTVNTGAATYTGRVSGSNFNFVDSSGNTIGTLVQPDTTDVLGCSGAMQPGGQPNESALLAVGAIVCAALNRATLSTSSFAGSDTQPTTNASSFYTQAISNQYAKVMHQNSVDGKAYGFAFDDVAGFSPSIDDQSAASAAVTVSPFSGGGGGSGSGSGGSSPYNNTGISSDSAQSAANFDGVGYSYSANALSAAGVNPGSTVSSDGFNFVWPNVAAGSPDNYQASGQTIPVSIPAGSTSLGILGSASEGDSSGTATITYTDGSTSTFTLSEPDWALGGGGEALPSGDTEAITTPYRNSSSGTSQTLNVYVFASSVPIDGSKTVQSVTLPSSVSGGALHVFAFAGSGPAYNCAAAVAGTALSRSGWVASTNTAASGGDVASNAIDGNLATRFSSDAVQASGMIWEANLGSAQSFDELQMQVPNSSGDYARGYNVEVSNNGSTWTTVASCTGTGDPEIVSFPAQNAQYVQVVLTAGAPSGNWWSIDELNLYTGTTAAPPTGGGLGSLGANTYVFTPSMSQATIQSDINTLYNQQVTNQFGTQRYALLFEPGTYGSASNPLTVNVGFYEEVAGLGQNPSQTIINGVVNSYNQCNGTDCEATDNFWRSIYNLTINVNSAGAIDSCHNNGDDFWATSQDSPIRRVQVNGTLTLMDFCDNPGYASGGYIGDSGFTGQVQNDSQQQFFVQNSNLSGGWTNAVWNQVFCGDNGAPAQSFASNSGDSGGPNSYTTLSTCGPTEQEPYLYEDGSGGLDLFVPSLQSGQVGTTWANGSTPGSSLPMSSFYIASPSSSAETINAALAAGDNILFTPGVYNLDQSLQVTNANTKLIGLGFATLIPQNGTAAVTVGDVAGVNLSGLIIDAGPTNSSVLLQIGVAGSSANYSSNPVTVDDLNIRIGGAEAGSATTAMVDDSNYSIIDNAWLWRADHGAGAGTWTGDQSATGLTVNGNNVSAYGLAVEHFQQYETVWNGQGGKVVFFQNENPYEVPSQSAWMASSTQNGYPAFYVNSSVTTFQGYGMGSYCYFDQGVAIENAMGFQAPSTSGVQFHDIFTRFLNGSGGIQSVINGTGAAVTSTNSGPADVVSYP